MIEEEEINELERELSKLKFEKQRLIIKSKVLQEDKYILKKRVNILILFVAFSIIFISLIFIFDFVKYDKKYKELLLSHLKIKKENTNLLLEIEDLQVKLLNNNKRKKSNNVYRVQISSFRKNIKIYNTKGFYKLRKGNRKSLCVGEFKDKYKALNFCKMLRRVGIYEAFVIYDDGVNTKPIKFKGYKHLSY